MHVNLEKKKVKKQRKNNELPTKMRKGMEIERVKE